MTSATTGSQRLPRAMALTDELVASVARTVHDTGIPAFYESMAELTADDDPPFHRDGVCGHLRGIVRLSYGAKLKFARLVCCEAG
jgi:hypothetical protein